MAQPPMGMGGSIGQPRPQPGQPGQPMPPQDGEPAVDDGETPNVSPEEQAEYDMFVGNAMKMIYTDGQNGPEVNPKILESLRSADDVVMTLAQTLVSLITALEQSAAKKGAQISDDVLFHGAVAVLEELVEIAQDALGVEISEEQMEGAMYQALDRYREANPTGRINPDELKAQFGQLVEADRNGALTQAIPELASRVQPQGGA